MKKFLRRWLGVDEPEKKPKSLKEVNLTILEELAKMNEGITALIEKASTLEEKAAKSGESQTPVDLEKSKKYFDDVLCEWICGEQKESDG